jgi:RNA polymerase sigma-70 factor (ECF subfamily)
MRSNTEWIAALNGSGDGQAAALSDLRRHVLRASLFTLQRALNHIGHLHSSIVRELAEDCTQETLTGLLDRLHAFRGDSQFTTWACAFAVHTAFATARRESRLRRSTISAPLAELPPVAAT